MFPPSPGTRAFLRFHLASGVRVALRTTTAKLILFVVALGMSEAPGKVLHQMARGLATGTGWVWLPLALAMWAMTDAQMARQRLLPTLHGWELHLPLHAKQRRRSFLLALVWAQAPVLGLWLMLWLLGLAMGEPVQLRMLLAIPVVALATGHALLPLQHPPARGLGAMALLLGGLPGWPTLAVSIALVLVADALAGPLQRRRPERMPEPRPTHPGGLPLRINLRAAGSGLARAYLTAAIPVALTWFFVRNNALTDHQFALGVRTGCGLGAALLMLELAGHLRAHRPPWGWSRSLPWTSRQRLLHDAAFLAAGGLPVLAAAIWLNPWAASSVAALLPYCGLRLAASLRPTESHITRLGARMVIEVLACTLAVAVTAWSAWLLLLLLPWALRTGEQCERRLKVGLWLEREHVASGDPLP